LELEHAGIEAGKETSHTHRFFQDKGGCKHHCGEILATKLESDEHPRAPQEPMGERFQRPRQFSFFKTKKETRVKGRATAENRIPVQTQASIMTKEKNRLQ